jgi:hypothetical protein
MEVSPPFGWMPFRTEKDQTLLRKLTGTAHLPEVA